MKAILAIFCLFFTILSSSAQTIAYDVSYFGNTRQGSCIDLGLLTTRIKGHQNNFEISFFSTLNDAEININSLPRFYTYTNLKEILYARVDNTTNSEFDVSEVEVNITFVPVIGPPAPVGLFSYSFCDINNDSSEIVYLDNLISGYPFGAPINEFCGLTNDQVFITYYLSQADAQNNTNQITNIFNLTETVEIYFKVTNTINSAVISGNFGLSLKTCSFIDTDNDGIQDSREDVNRNSYSDDDTDKDGLKNFEDADDDGDGILTIHEDYNNNGDPTDDDLDGNGIADYLQKSVAIILSNQEFQSDNFIIYPNPVSDVLFIKNDKNIGNGLISIYSLDGKFFKTQMMIKNNLNKIDVSKLSKGVYFLQIENKTVNQIKKIIID